MQNHYNSETMMAWSAVRPLKDLTTAEFTALGGNAMVYIRSIKGTELAKLLADPEFATDEVFQLVVAADGMPLLVTDSAEKVTEWLDEMNFGVVSLH